MTGFAVDWLRLREPYDRAARAPELLAGLADWARGRTGLHVVDLGAGTGSARRALAGHLPADAAWTLVENDPALIAAGQAAFGDDARVGYRQADLDQDLDAIFAGQVDLVTASALIDLVSEPWLDRLVAHVLRRRCAVWIGLTYDGDLAFEPELPEDAEVAAAFDRDMTRDKGFGKALGPAAHDALASRLEGHGRLFTGSSPWRLGPQDRPIIDALIDGIGDAAAAPGSWRRQRHAVTTALRVGHRDLLFLP
jgi:SAM-dependent methyltransferase